MNWRPSTGRETKRGSAHSEFERAQEREPDRRDPRGRKASPGYTSLAELHRSLKFPHVVEISHATGRRVDEIKGLRPPRVNRGPPAGGARNRQGDPRNPSGAATNSIALETSRYKGRAEPSQTRGCGSPRIPRGAPPDQEPEEIHDDGDLQRGSESPHRQGGAP